MRALIVFIVLSLSVPAFGQQEDKDKYILRLEKTIAELQMQLYELRYKNARVLWKEKLKALGEPDPDATAAQPEAKDK